MEVSAPCIHIYMRLMNSVFDMTAKIYLCDIFEGLAFASLIGYHRWVFIHNGLLVCMHKYVYMYIYIYIAH